MAKFVIKDVGQWFAAFEVCYDGFERFVAGSIHGTVAETESYLRQAISEQKNKSQVFKELELEL